MKHCYQELSRQAIVVFACLFLAAAASAQQFCENFDDGSGWQSRWTAFTYTGSGGPFIVNNPVHSGTQALIYSTCWPAIVRNDFEAADGIYTGWVYQTNTAMQGAQFMIQSNYNGSNYLGNQNYCLEFSCAGTPGPGGGTMVISRRQNDVATDVTPFTPVRFGLNEWVKIYIIRDGNVIRAGYERLNGDKDEISYTDPTPLPAGKFIIMSCGNGANSAYIWDDVSYNPDPNGSGCGSQPACPQAPTVTAEGFCDHIQLSWSDVGNEATYQVLRNGIAITPILQPHTSTYSDNTVISGSQNYRVNVTVPGCELISSNEVSVSVAQDNKGPLITFIGAEYSRLDPQSGLLLLLVGFSDLTTCRSMVDKVEYFFQRNIPPGSGTSSRVIPAVAEGSILLTIDNRIYEADSLYVRACDEFGNWGDIYALDVFGSKPTTFDPVINGFHFPNRNTITLVGHGFGDIGLCMGMSAAAWSYFTRGVHPIPGDGQVWPTPFSELDYRIWAHHILGNAISIPTFENQQSENYRFIDEYKALKTRLSGGMLALISLTEDGDWIGHQVLGYSLVELGSFSRIGIYDPNKPGQAAYLSVNTSSWTMTPYYCGDESPSDPLNANRLAICPYFPTIAVVAMCPIELQLTDPLGRIVNSSRSEIDDAFYSNVLADNDTSRTIILPTATSGAYGIDVRPLPGANLDTTFSMYIYIGNEFIPISINESVAKASKTRYWFTTEDKGQLRGKVMAADGALAGVTLDVISSSGNLWASTVTDDSGRYQIEDIPNGDYAIAIVTPLGFETAQETKEFTVHHVSVTIDFNLTKLEITPRQRSRAYWANQINKALINKPQDYTRVQFLRFGGLINQHFNDNLINPVENYVVPQPATQNDSLTMLNKLLSFQCIQANEPLLKRIARGELLALMLNVVSGKVSQTQTVTKDGMSLSQAITYCDLLVNDLDITIGDVPDEYRSQCGRNLDWMRYVKASFIAGLINVGVTLPAGAIPSDVLNIAYKYQAEHPEIPTDFALSQNYPNPFNPVTTISFSLPKATSVTIDVFNIMGQKVATLVNGPMETGEHQIYWDSKDQWGKSVASGIYFYRLKAGSFINTKKMSLIK